MSLQSKISTFCGAYCLSYQHARNSDRLLASKTMFCLFSNTDPWLNDNHVQQLIMKRFVEDETHGLQRTKDNYFKCPI